MNRDDGDHDGKDSVRDLSYIHDEVVDLCGETEVELHDDNHSLPTLGQMRP